MYNPKLSPDKRIQTFSSDNGTSSAPCPIGSSPHESVLRRSWKLHIGSGITSTRCHCLLRDVRITPLCTYSRFPTRLWPISHHCLFQILHRYGINEWFIERLHALYENATASVQINGTLAGHIPIQSAVRQDGPLSMILYALCLHPPSHTRRQPAGHQTRPKYAEPHIRRITWWCNHTSNQTWRYRHHPRGRVMLRKSHWRKAQLKEIEGPSRWGGRTQKVHSELNLTTK